MKVKALLSIVCCLLVIKAPAQKPFTEGTLNYKVKLEAADKTYEGTYTFIIKGGQIRKELQLNNGFRDIVIINTTTNTIYSLRTENGKKYAIQLRMDDMEARQKKYVGYSFSEDKNTGKLIAGLPTFKGNITYTDGSRCEIYYSHEWRPDKNITFERFPDARFLPLSFTYKDDNNFTMRMEADNVNISPVENAVFRVPVDYKIITNEEYKQLSR